MNYIDYHVVSTAVMGGLGIVFFIGAFAAVYVTVMELFNEKDNQ